MKNKFLSLSIHTHLVILMFLLTLPFMILIVHSGIVQRSEAIENAKKESLKFISIIAGEQQSMVSGVEQLVMALSFLPELQSRNVEATDTILVDLMKKNPQYTNIAVMDKDGWVWGTAAAFTGKLSLGDRKYFKDAVRTGEFSSGEFTIGRISGKPIINFGYPVKDRSNRLIAVIGAAFDLEYIRHNFKKMNLPAGSSFSVMDRTGITLYTDLSDNRSGRLAEKHDSDIQIFNKMKDGPDEGTFEAVGNEGTPLFIAYKKIGLPNESEPYLYIRSSIPRNSAASGANAAMIKNLAVLISFSLVWLLLSWFIGKLIILNPIRLLRTASQQLAAGADVVNVSSIVRGGEFGELALAFDHMAETLVQREAAKNAAETALRESEGKFRDLAEKSLVGINLVQDGLIKYVNETCADMVEYRVDEIIDKMTVKDVIHPDDLPLAEENIRRHMSGEMKSARYELRICAKSGKIKYTESFSSATQYRGKLAIITSVLDITDRKKAEDELRRLSTAVEQAAEEVIITDTEGVIQYVNPAFEKITGYTREDVIGRTPRVLKSGVHDADFYKVLWGTIQGGHVWTGRITNRKQDGKLIQEDATITPLFDSALQIIGYVSLKKDVTEEVKLEAQFFHAQKMEAVGTLAAGIAHDFNNILSSILGHATLLQFDLSPDHPHYKRLQDIESQVMSGASLTRHLLGFARGGKYEVKPTDLNKFVEKSSEMFGRTEKGISIKKTFQQGIWTVAVDQGQIEQVLLNIFINAAHAMSGEGNIYLETKNVELREADVRPHGVKTGRYVKLSVTDTGKGMDKATLERIFDPFFTTKDPGKGTGLGLASAYGIIKNHGGFITVYSEPDKGSTFCINLPASESEAESIYDDKQIDLTLRGRETILAVDDEKGNLSLTKQILENLGYRVFTAESGQEAIAIFKESGKDIDLIILDMIMPGMSGRKVFDTLRAMAPAAKILLSSGYSINGEAQQLMDQGCNGFIQKPFRIQELSKKIREVL
jgi:two-component system, cell cycle sensor histidine kinase and response regulator CckA